MPRGGRRNGAGRKRGSENRETQEARAMLAANSGRLLRKAIQLATAAEPNVTILCKLIERILPSLHAADVEVRTRMRFEGQSPAFLAELADEYEKCQAAKGVLLVDEIPDSANN